MIRSQGVEHQDRMIKCIASKLRAVVGDVISDIGVTIKPQNGPWKDVVLAKRALIGGHTDAMSRLALR